MTDNLPDPQAIETKILAKAHGCLAKPTQVELDLPDPPSTVAAQVIADSTTATEESAGGPA